MITGDRDTLVVPATYSRGRTCAYGGCRTVLSQYNPDEYCAAHIRKAPESKPTDLGTYYKACKACGYWKDGRAYAKDEAHWDGLAEVCKRCAKKKPATTKNEDLAAWRNKGRTQVCKHCADELPARLEYFSWKRDAKFLLDTVCKRCRCREEKERTAAE